jgi:hypothetical protein
MSHASISVLLCSRWLRSYGGVKSRIAARTAAQARRKSSKTDQMMKQDNVVAMERVRSEALSVLVSIHSYRNIDSAYFDRLREAVRDAVTFFHGEPEVPVALLKELDVTANVLRNEATAFPGRTAACSEMADWLQANRQVLAKMVDE